MNKNKPIASIIVPCYNKAQYLAETLDSVLNQLFCDWECIIVNDGSSDETEEIAKGYCEIDTRFKYLFQENSGVSAARNNGIRASSGYYLLPLDSDDLLSEKYLQYAVDYLESNPECKLVYPRVELFGGQKGMFVLPEYSYEKEIWENVIVCSAVFRRADFDKTSGYNENMRGGFEDWDFYLSFLSEKDVVKRLDIIGLSYRILNNSRNVQAQVNREELCKQVLRNHPSLYQKYYDSLIYYKTEQEHLCGELVEIKNSLPYKIGQMIAIPYRRIRYGTKL